MPASLQMNPLEAMYCAQILSQQQPTVVECLPPPPPPPPTRQESARRPHSDCLGSLMALSAMETSPHLVFPSVRSPLVIGPRVDSLTAHHHYAHSMVYPSLHPGVELKRPHSYPCLSHTPLLQEPNIITSEQLRYSPEPVPPPCPPPMESSPEEEGSDSSPSQSDCESPQSDSPPDTELSMSPLDPLYVSYAFRLDRQGNMYQRPDPRESHLAPPPPAPRPSKSKAASTCETKRVSFASQCQVFPFEDWVHRTYQMRAEKALSDPDKHDLKRGGGLLSGIRKALGMQREEGCPCRRCTKAGTM